MQRFAQRFAAAFKNTMTATNLQAARLAEEAGRSRNNISSVRNGRVSPTLESFEELLEAAEKLHPGFFEVFLLELGGGEISEEAIAHLPPEKKARILQAVANSLTKSKNGKTVLSR